MAKGLKKVVVAQGRATIQKQADVLQATKDTLRKLAPLGVRFSVTETDASDTSIEAWVETPAERKPRAVAGTNGTASTAPVSTERATNQA